MVSLLIMIKVYANLLLMCKAPSKKKKKNKKKKTTFWKMSKSQWWGWYTLTRSKMDLISYGVLILRITTNKSDKVDITKIRLFKYIENFTTKKGKFSDKKKYFWYFCSKQSLWVLVRTTSVRRSKRVPIIYGFFFFSKIRKIIYSLVNFSFTV